MEISKPIVSGEDRSDHTSMDVNHTASVTRFIIKHDST